MARSLDVTATLTIDRPPEAVAAYAFDPGNDPAWIGGVREIERISSGPTSVGSQVIRRGSFMGRPLEWLMEVVDLVPARRIALHAIRSPFPMDVTYTLEPSGANGRSTRTSIGVQGSASGFYGLAGPLLPRMVRSSILGDAKRLKRLVEST